MAEKLRLIDLIPYGKKNATPRRNLVNTAELFGLVPDNISDSDRYVRKLIQDARKNNVIICDANGYYIPDEDDVTELSKYIVKEHSRALAIHTDIKMARAVLEDMQHGRLKKPERRYGDDT